MEHILTMLEVSQKQSYIFSSNKLKDNITNSAVIAWIMSPEYFQKTVNDEKIFDMEKNLVYSGGGHIVLEFKETTQAVEFVKRVTYQIHKDYAGIDVFAVVEPYESDNLGECLKDLTAKLELKKSRRLAAFHQGTFGIEKINSTTLKPECCENKCEMPKQEEKTDRELSPQDYERAMKFEDLGGSRNESNFIAVVHIDGNAMGKRVEALYTQNKNASWEDYKKKLRNFSSSIDSDFKEAYRDMTDEVCKNIENGNLKMLNIKKFPVRRIITAGDDICFVTEGRIGIECAVSFIRALGKKINSEDKTGYAACGGIAVVHQKYPFYKAYELAEMLCSNAKKFGASLSEDGTGRDISAIDWHIEFGEIKDTLEEIRQDYQTLDGKRMELRPYIVSASDKIMKKETIRRYENFKKLILAIQDEKIAYARGKMKELRTVLKEGETAATSFTKFNKLDEIALEGYQGIYKEVSTDKIASGEGLERKLFVRTQDNVERAAIFDALEVWDTYIGFEEAEQ